MHRWARLIGRTMWFWIVAWPVVAIGVWASAPRIPTLLADDATGFLPADMPSQRAFERLRAEFPDQAPASRAAILFARDSGMTSADKQLLADMARQLQARSDTLGWQIRASALNPMLTPFLESPDGKAAVIAIDLPAALLTHSTVRRVREVKDVVAAHAPAPGATVEVTGSGALGELLDKHAKRDVNATTMWAFAAVALILMVVYRSPVAMLLPVVTIGLSIMLALGLLGHAAARGLPINGLVEMFITVILVGSGVDYCLFLFARFQEELAGGTEPTAAVEAAVARTGAAILASAGTNVVGLGCLALGRNRDLYTSGPTIAAAICVATIAVLTLTPSLMRLVGRHLTWPTGVRRQTRESYLWGSVARLIAAHPRRIALCVMLVLAVPAWIGARVDPLYDSFDEFPADSSFVRGARLYERHFGETAGVNHQTLIISADQRLDEAAVLPAAREALDQLADALAKRFPIAYQRDVQDPLGTMRSRPDKTPADVVAAAVASTMTRDVYVGRSGRALRVDIGLHTPARTAAALDEVAEIRRVAERALSQSPLAQVCGSLVVETTGESPIYADIRAVRERDMRVIACAAITAIFVILVVLIRSWLKASILIAATLLTYLAAYGITWLVFTTAFGVESLSYQINFLLFIIILSLGQDYNIYVVSRIREESARCSPEDSVTKAVSATGKVVSSCGLIMAAAFASMCSGSLLVMKEFGVALSVGILIDTFLVRPLLVPALILLTLRRDRSLDDGRSSTSPACVAGAD